MASVEGVHYQPQFPGGQGSVALTLMEPRGGARPRTRSGAKELQDLSEERNNNSMKWPGSSRRPSSSESPGNSDRPISFSRPDSSGRPGSSMERPHSTLERPGSALARGVQITEYRESRVNPEPVSVEEADLMMESYLSPGKLVRILSLEDLRDLTGMEDLRKVQYMEMKVDARETSLGNFGTHLPNLSQLKLSNSVILTVRDLGSSLHNLKVLWMARCGLEDLDGVYSMMNLEELYLAYNEIADISPCSMLEHIKILDLEGNNIEDITQIESLGLCSNLQQLTLEGNPICVMPSPDADVSDYDYRDTVKKYIPNLTLLDDEPLESSNSDHRKSSSAFDEDWKLIEEFLNDGIVLQSEEDQGYSSGRPGTSLRPTTGYRPGSALKQRLTSPLRPSSGAPSSPLTTASSGVSSRPHTGRPGSARPSTASVRASPDDLEDTEGTSDLTRGTVVCGNPSKALKSRVKATVISESLSPAAQLLAIYRKENPQPAQMSKKENDPHLKALFGEIDEWRKLHEKTKQSIAQEKEPQILRIDHDDSDVVMSDDDGSVSSGDIDGDKEDEILYSLITCDKGDTQSIPNDYRKECHSSELSPEPSNRLRRVILSDESFEAQEESLTRESTLSSGSSSHSSSRLGYLDDTRPNSGPAISTGGKFKLGPVVDKTNPKKMDKTNAIVRTALQTPEKLVPEGPRAATGSIASPPSLNPRRKLPNVPLLPSKPVPK